MEEAPPAPCHLLSKAWSAETLNAGMVTVDAQSCKSEAVTPDTDAARKLRIEENALHVLVDPFHSTWPLHLYRLHMPCMDL